MADVHTKAQRSYNMSRIRASRTVPELILKNKLKGALYQPKGMFGRPDFVDFKRKRVIFVDGCFWHECPVHFIKPKSNKKFWNLKLMRNKVRDGEVSKAYRLAGWKVLRVWEHNLTESL